MRKKVDWYQGTRTPCGYFISRLILSIMYDCSARWCVFIECSRNNPWGMGL